jgi:hypothetical protein
MHGSATSEPGSRCRRGNSKVVVREPAREQRDRILRSAFRPMENFDRSESALRRFLLQDAERISYLAIDNCGHLHGSNKNQSIMTSSNIRRSV